MMIILKYKVEAQPHYYSECTPHQNSGTVYPLMYINYRLLMFVTHLIIGMMMSVWAGVHVRSSPPTIYWLWWWFGKCAGISAAWLGKIFCSLNVFYGPNQMGSFVIKITGTWVRWNSELGIISVPPNSCTVILGETPILSYSFYWE